MSEETRTVNRQDEKVGIVAYLALIFALVFFSGVLGELSKMGDGQWTWLSAFDYVTLCGKFGSLGSLTDGSGTLAANFRGIEGSGPRDAFLFGISLVPPIMFALGIVRIINNLGALKAASKLLTPILRFILGVPGSSAISLVSNFQSADVGATMVKSLKDEDLINEKEQMILTAFEYSCPAIMVNYFSIGAAVFAFLEIPLYIPIVVLILCKLIGGNIMRLIAGRLIKHADAKEKVGEN
ncbi:MAG: nucleoside recognition domain-containing protein [Lachnospiraceae bacterium]